MIHEMTPGVEPGRRARARERRLDEIVTAAMEIVRADGLDALTTHRVAERLDVAVGALYRYFPSKAAMLGALERAALEALGAHLTRSLDEAEGAFRGRGAALASLVLAGRAYGRFTREHATEAGLIGQLVADPRVMVPGAEGAAVLAATMALLGPVASRFERAAGDGVLAPGDALERSVLYWSGLRGVLELAKLRAHHPGVDAAALADAMTRALLVGFGAEPEAVGRAFTAVKRFAERHGAEVST